VVVDIGREPLARMPFDWARQGSRMPLVIPSNFILSSSQSSSTSASTSRTISRTSTGNNSNRNSNDNSNYSNNNNLKLIVHPQLDNVGFTGPEGAVQSPIQGGKWKLSSKDNNSSSNNNIAAAAATDNDNNDDNDSSTTMTTTSSSSSPLELTFSYTLTEELRRNDVYLEAGIELFLSTRVYTKTTLDRLNKEYYTAREKMWKDGEDLNVISNRQGASKKWNTQTEQWEKRYPNENPFQFIKKQISYWGAKVKQNQTRNQRPEVETLSDSGGKLPIMVVNLDVDVDVRMSSDSGSNSDSKADDDDYDDFVFLAKNGIIRYGGEKGPVCGLFTAQPITNVPAWNRGK